MVEYPIELALLNCFCPYVVQVSHVYYPEWNDFAAEMKVRDVRLLVYVNPYLVDVKEGNFSHRRNLFKEATEKGYLVKNIEGENYCYVPSSASMVVIVTGHNCWYIWPLAPLIQASL